MSAKQTPSVKKDATPAQDTAKAVIVGAEKPVPPTTNPAQQPVEQAAPAEQKAAVPSNGKSILIVEDERPLAHALEMKLKNEGYVTHICMNGSDALEEIKKGTYNLMLLDLIMPVLDGFTVLSEMKAKGVKTPVIVLSNLGQEEDKAKTKELGAIGYFVKSNTPLAEIIKAIKAAL